MSKEKLITMKQAMELLGEDYKYSQVYELVKKHILENFGEKRILIKESQVIEYKERAEKMMKQSVVSPFGNIVLAYDESLKLLDNIYITYTLTLLCKSPIQHTVANIPLTISMVCLYGAIKP